VCEGEDLVDAARRAGVEPVDVIVAGEHVEPRLLAEVSTLPHPARVIAVFRREDLPSGGLDGVGLALWHVADPGNVGTLVRTVDGLGASFVALSQGCADPLGPKAVRASAGAVFRVPLGRFEDAPRPWIALVPEGGQPLERTDVGASGSFALGAEREGLPPAVLERCDAAASIGLAADAESLNVAVAGAIALYEWRRRPR
jgi:TrmH family RNA methyltransferase